MFGILDGKGNSEYTDDVRSYNWGVVCAPRFGAVSLISPRGSTPFIRAVIPLALGKAHRSAVLVLRVCTYRGLPYVCDLVVLCSYSLSANSTTPTSTVPLGNAGGAPTPTDSGTTTTTIAHHIGGLGGALSNFSPRVELAALVVIGSSLASLFF